MITQTCDSTYMTKIQYQERQNEEILHLYDSSSAVLFNCFILPFYVTQTRNMSACDLQDRILPLQSDCVRALINNLFGIMATTAHMSMETAEGLANRCWEEGCMETARLKGLLKCVCDNTRIIVPDIAYFHPLEVDIAYKELEVYVNSLWGRLEMAGRLKKARKERVRRRSVRRQLNLNESFNHVDRFSNFPCVDSANKAPPFLYNCGEQTEYFNSFDAGLDTKPKKHCLTSGVEKGSVTAQSCTTRSNYKGFLGSSLCGGPPTPPLKWQRRLERQRREEEEKRKETKGEDEEKKDDGIDDNNRYRAKLLIYELTREAKEKADEESGKRACLERHQSLSTSISSLSLSPPSPPSPPLLPVLSPEAVYPRDSEFSLDVELPATQPPSKDDFCSLECSSKNPETLIPWSPEKKAEKSSLSLCSEDMATQISAAS